MAERVEEASLTVNAPWRLVVAYLVDAAVCSGCHGTFDEAVGVVHDDLDSHRPCANGRGSVPAVVLGFAQEERGSLDGQPHDTTKVPQLGGSKCPCVPLRAALPVALASGGAQAGADAAHARQPAVAVGRTAPLELRHLRVRQDQEAA